MPLVSDADKARLEAAREQINKLMQRDAKVKDESDLYNKLIKQARCVGGGWRAGLTACRRRAIVASQRAT
jgi:hypothetical protein